MFPDDFVIIFLLAIITTTAKNTHTRSLTYNTLFMHYRLDLLGKINAKHCVRILSNKLERGQKIYCVDFGNDKRNSVENTEELIAMYDQWR